jgi:hypothetical protein
MVDSEMPIKTDQKAGQSMLHTLTNYWLVWTIFLVAGFFPVSVEGQGVRLAAATEQRVKENPCPLCGQPWRGRVDLEVTIPDKLPTPKNQLWIQKLRLALATAQQVKTQFKTDQRNFGVSNPYLYVLPQIDQHIAWIGKLFSAYGLPPRGKIPPVKTFESPGTLLHVLKNGRKMELDLASQYEWLLRHAEDKVTQRVLNTILTQTNINVVLFQNDIRIIEIEGSLVPSLL